MSIERLPNLTVPGLALCLSVDLSVWSELSPSVAGPIACDLLGALFRTVSVLSGKWGR
jgi:hypothetical protein